VTRVGIERGKPSDTSVFNRLRNPRNHDVEHVGKACRRFESENAPCLLHRGNAVLNIVLKGWIGDYAEALVSGILAVAECAAAEALSSRTYADLCALVAPRQAVALEEAAGQPS